MESNVPPELFNISQITNNIFISGIFPLNGGGQLIKELKIKHILSCVGRDNISQVHDQIMMENPNVTILYLPYDDEVQQNLWQKNDNCISMFKFTSSMTDHKKIMQQLNTYNKKPLIEIGYHFINNAISKKENILIHCMAGISRSVSVATYFLMKKYQMNFHNSYVFIKKYRGIAKPNSSFRLQLEKYYIKKDKFTENDADDIISTIANETKFY